jgi:hypothetical protein
MRAARDCQGEEFPRRRNGRTSQGDLAGQERNRLNHLGSAFHYYRDSFLPVFLRRGYQQDIEGFFALREIS